MFLTVVLINEMPFLILIEESIQNPRMKIKALFIIFNYEEHYLVLESDKKSLRRGKLS